MKAALPLQSGCGTAELAGMTYIGALGVACVCCWELWEPISRWKARRKRLLGPQVAVVTLLWQLLGSEDDPGIWRGDGMGEWDGGLELGRGNRGLDVGMMASLGLGRLLRG